MRSGAIPHEGTCIGNASAPREERSNPSRGNLYRELWLLACRVLKSSQLLVLLKRCIHKKIWIVTRQSRWLRHPALQIKNDLESVPVAAGAKKERPVVSTNIPQKSVFFFWPDGGQETLPLQKGKNGMCFAESERGYIYESEVPNIVLDTAMEDTLKIRKAGAGKKKRISKKTCIAKKPSAAEEKVPEASTAVVKADKKAGDVSFRFMWYKRAHAVGVVRVSDGKKQQVGQVGGLLFKHIEKDALQEVARTCVELVEKNEMNLENLTLESKTMLEKLESK